MRTVKCDKKKQNIEKKRQKNTLRKITTIEKKEKKVNRIVEEISLEKKLDYKKKWNKNVEERCRKEEEKELEEEWKKKWKRGVEEEMTKRTR